MKLLRRYFLAEFFPPFIGTLALACVIFLVYEFFFRVSEFIMYHASFTLILTYLVVQTPLWVKDAFAISTLSGVVFSLKRFSRDGELTAMKANGINIHNAVVPLILLGLAFSCIGAVMNIQLVPDCYLRRREIITVQLHRQNSESEKRWYNIVASGIQGEGFTINYYNYTSKTMKDVTIDYLSKKFTLQKQIVVKEMRYSNGKWLLTDGIERAYSENGAEILKETPFQSMVLVIPDKPDDFMPGAVDTDVMTGPELRKEITRLKKHGMAYSKQLGTYYFRYAYPFSSLVATLLAIPFCIGMKGDKLGQILSIAYIVGICFIYYLVMNIGRAFGMEGGLPPLLGAWFGNIVFSVIGVALMFRVRR